MTIVVVIAAVVGPKGPTEPPDPTLAGANPRPEWPFLWLFGLLSLSPPAIETFIMLVFPVLVLGASSSCRSSATAANGPRDAAPRPC